MNWEGKMLWARIFLKVCSALAALRGAEMWLSSQRVVEQGFWRDTGLVLATYTFSACFGRFENHRRMNCGCFFIISFHARDLVFQSYSCLIFAVCNNYVYYETVCKEVLSMYSPVLPRNVWQVKSKLSNRSFHERNYERISNKLSLTYNGGMPMCWYQIGVNSHIHIKMMLSAGSPSMPCSAPETYGGAREHATWSPYDNNGGYVSCARFCEKSRIACVNLKHTTTHCFCVWQHPPFIYNLRGNRTNIWCGFFLESGLST